MKKLCCSA